MIRNSDPNTNGGNPSSTDINQTVESVYTNGLRTKLIARMPSSGDDQETIYTYGTVKGTDPGESKIATGNLLREVKYPDSSSGTDVVAYAYNAQGQTVWTKDQVGRVIESVYDESGRRLHERVTTSGGFDTAILRISTTYDDLGRVEKVTSWNHATPGSGTVVNEVASEYDGWGNLVEFKSDRTGAIGANAYPVLYQYGKSSPSDARRTLRRTQMTYPNGDITSYAYSSSGGLFDDSVSRVTEIKEVSTTRVTYQYLGVGALVGTTYNQPVLLNRVYDGFSNAYDGLDRFGRPIVSRWEKAAQSDRYNVALTYDRNSNVVTIDDSVQSGLDWKYTYDALDRLTEAKAGTLSMGNITSETRQQVWDLDQPGNWKHTELEENDATTIFDWDFEHNKANEITDWDNQTNTVDPVYDAAGNLVNDKRHWKYEYDAWYRVVKVRDLSDDVIAEFKYNGLNQRISARYNESGPWYHFAHDERWRIIATYVDNDPPSEPTEQFWYHNAGASGYGGSSYIDDVVLRDRRTTEEAALDERFYYLQNWHHDVVALCTTGGAVEERVNYDAYGSPIGAFTTVGNRKGYAGYEYDAELSNAGSHTYHVRNRVYRADLGIWTRRDPMGYVDGVNLLIYALARPINHTDPLGLFSEEWSDPCFTCKQGVLEAKNKRKFRDIYKNITDSISHYCSCSDIKIECVSPRDRDSLGWQTCVEYNPNGFTNCPAWAGGTGCPAIYLCCNNKISINNFSQTLIEELIHAFDCCHFGQQWAIPNIESADHDCARCICAEIRGSIGSLECTGKPPKESCLRGEAEKSCKTTKPNRPMACNAGQFDRVFDSVKKFCIGMLPQPWTPLVIPPGDTGTSNPISNRCIANTGV